MARSSIVVASFVLGALLLLGSTSASGVAQPAGALALGTNDVFGTLMQQMVAEAKRRELEEQESDGTTPSSLAEASGTTAEESSNESSSEESESSEEASGEGSEGSSEESWEEESSELSSNELSFGEESSTAVPARRANRRLLRGAL